MDSSEDKELSAMNAVLSALQPLDAPAQVRVLRWAWERFAPESPLTGEIEKQRHGETRPETFDDVADVVHATGASTGPERALSVAFWLQELGQRPSFTAQEVNTALKNLGHPLANVTKTLDSLRAQRPSLVMQLSKSGRSQQARKTYRLTTAGIQRVKNMLAEGVNTGEAAA